MMHPGIPFASCQSGPVDFSPVDIQTRHEKKKGKYIARKQKRKRKRRPVGKRSLKGKFKQPDQQPCSDLM